MVAISSGTSVSTWIPGMNAKNERLQETPSDLLTFGTQKIYRFITNLQNTAKPMSWSSAAANANEQMSLDRGVSTEQTPG